MMYVMNRKLLHTVLPWTNTLPGNLITAGHGEQPLSLKYPVPSLDGVAGPHGDGALSRLNFGPQLASCFAIWMSVPLI